MPWGRYFSPTLVTESIIKELDKKVNYECEKRRKSEKLHKNKVDYIECLRVFLVAFFQYP